MRLVSSGLLNLIPSLGRIAFLLLWTHSPSCLSYFWRIHSCGVLFVFVVTVCLVGCLADWLMFVCFETRFPYVAQIGLQLAILSPQLLERWDCRPVTISTPACDGKRCLSLFIPVHMLRKGNASMSLNLFPTCPHNGDSLGYYINTKTPYSTPFIQFVLHWGG